MCKSALAQAAQRLPARLSARLQALLLVTRAKMHSNVGARPGARRMVSLGKVTAPKPVNLPSQRSENNGLDPNVVIVPKTSSTWGNPNADPNAGRDPSPSGPWGPQPGQPAPPAQPAPAPLPPRAIPAAVVAPPPAWGGAGVRPQGATGLLKRDEFPTLGTTKEEVEKQKTAEIADSRFAPAGRAPAGWGQDARLGPGAPPGSQGGPAVEPPGPFRGPSPQDRWGPSAERWGPRDGFEREPLADRYNGPRLDGPGHFDAAYGPGPGFGTPPGPARSQDTRSIYGGNAVPSLERAHSSSSREDQHAGAVADARANHSTARPASSSSRDWATLADEQMDFSQAPFPEDASPQRSTAEQTSSAEAVRAATRVSPAGAAQERGLASSPRDIPGLGSGDGRGAAESPSDHAELSSSHGSQPTKILRPERALARQEGRPEEGHAEPHERGEGRREDPEDSGGQAGDRRERPVRPRQERRSDRPRAGERRDQPGHGNGQDRAVGEGAAAQEHAGEGRGRRERGGKRKERREPGDRPHQAERSENEDPQDSAKDSGTANGAAKQSAEGPERSGEQRAERGGQHAERGGRGRSGRGSRGGEGRERREPRPEREHPGDADSQKRETVEGPPGLRADGSTADGSQRAKPPRRERPQSSKPSAQRNPDAAKGQGTQNGPAADPTKPSGSGSGSGSASRPHSRADPKGGSGPEGAGQRERPQPGGGAKHAAPAGRAERELYKPPPAVSDKHAELLAPRPSHISQNAFALLAEASESGAPPDKAPAKPGAAAAAAGGQKAGAAGGSEQAGGEPTANGHVGRARGGRGRSGRDRKPRSSQDAGAEGEAGSSTPQRAERSEPFGVGTTAAYAGADTGRTLVMQP
ncbi:hypothetical protein WJX72_001470 [[Myrmecia] bisecta]|uniref:BAT2 N-terminal domain-containing protein n=1 Tax=[Myrmecia] bisecta TaxID=41462 RepID=A0AAW1P7W3_9CHLO